MNPETYAAPVLSQRDSAWKAVKIGNQTVETLGSVGCLTTCKAMLLAIPDVAAMNKLLVDAGHYGRGQYGAYATTFDVARFRPNIRLKKVSPKYERVLAPPDLVAEYARHVASGQPAIVEVNFYKRFRPGGATGSLLGAFFPGQVAERGYKPVTVDAAQAQERPGLAGALAASLATRFRFSQHFVLSTGLGVIHDPWPMPGSVQWPQVCPLTPDYGPSLAVAIVRVIFYEVM